MSKLEACNVNFSSQIKIQDKLVKDLKGKVDSSKITRKAITPIVATSTTKETGDKIKSIRRDSSNEQLNKYPKLYNTNLQIIEGIGPKLEAVLNENGINTWSDLSTKSFGELRAILDKYGTRYSVVNPSSWSRQATLAIKYKWDELIAYQSQGGTPSKLNKILIRLGLKT